MGGYVEVGALKTWYDEQGEGEPLVLLHGGMCTNATWAAQMPEFSTRCRVIAPERRGHGHTPDLEGPLSYDVMSADMIGFLDAVVGGPAYLVGWSDGGVVGLLVAMARPDLVRKLVVIGTNFDTSGLTPEAMEGFRTLSADSDDLAMLREPYQAVTPDGPGHWPAVVAKFKEMVSTQPAITVEQLGRITAPTLVVVGDDDIVTLDHTSTLFRAIPNSELAVVPGTSHFLTMEKPDLVNRLVLDFSRGTRCRHTCRGDAHRPAPIMSSRRMADRDEFFETPSG
jgi:pimeloyl-ACP methyl ester carboxylesterase